MSKIVEIFLKEIPQIIHEPIAITALLYYTTTLHAVKSFFIKALPIP